MPYIADNDSMTFQRKNFLFLLEQIRHKNLHDAVDQIDKIDNEQNIPYPVFESEFSTNNVVPDNYESDEHPYNWLKNSVGRHGEILLFREPGSQQPRQSQR